MSNAVPLTFRVSATHDTADITVKCAVSSGSQQTVTVGTEPQTVNLTIDQDDLEQTLSLTIEMQGKTANHTTVDSEGIIVNDVLVNIDNFLLDGIDITNTVQKLSEYSHNHNGTTPQVQHKFYGTMGCNGTVSMQLTTPVYLWMLEHL